MDAQLPHRSIAVLLSAGGATLDRSALTDVPLARVLGAEFAWGERAACATATLEHDCDLVTLLHSLRAWAGARGWSVTVAPLPGGG